MASALPREVFAARQERTEPGWNKALLFLASGGPARGPPRPAELAELARMRRRFFGTGFPGGLPAGEREELTVLGCAGGTGRNEGAACRGLAGGWGGVIAGEPGRGQG